MCVKVCPLGCACAQLLQGAARVQWVLVCAAAATCCACCDALLACWRDQSCLPDSLSSYSIIR